MKWLHTVFGILFVLSLAFAITTLEPIESMKNKSLHSQKHFHGSSSVPVEKTTDMPNMNLRDNKSTSYEYNFKFDISDNHEIPDRYKIIRPDRH